MFVFRKGIGKLKHLSYYEKNQIIDNLPVNIGYDVVAMVGTGDEKYDYYDLKLFRKKDKDGKSQWKKCFKWRMEDKNMKYTVQLDFFIDEDAIRTDEEVKEVVEEIFDYSNCNASNIKVIDVNDWYWLNSRSMVVYERRIYIYE